jgi:integrase
LWALIVVLWRGGLRIQEALALIESDLDPRRGSILVRKGKGNGRRVRVRGHHDRGIRRG